MSNKTRKRIWPVALMSLAVFGVLAAVIALTAVQPQAAQAHDCDSATMSASDYAGCLRDHRVGGLDGSDSAHNHPPMAKGSIAAATLDAGQMSEEMDVSMYFEDLNEDDTLTYAAASSNMAVATAALGNGSPFGNGSSMLTITAVAAGEATITVTASDGEASATQKIMVTVLAIGPTASDHAPPPEFLVQALDNGARLDWEEPMVGEGASVIGYRIHRDAWNDNAAHPINMSGDTVFNEISTATHYFDLGLAYETVYTYRIQAIVEYEVGPWWDMLTCAEMNMLAGSNDTPGTGFCQDYKDLTADQKTVVGSAYSDQEGMHPPMGSYGRYALGEMSRKRTIETADSGGRLNPLLDPPTEPQDVRTSLLLVSPDCNQKAQITLRWMEPADAGTRFILNANGQYVGPDYRGGNIAGLEEVGEDAEIAMYMVEYRVDGGQWMAGGNVMASDSMTYVDDDVDYTSTYEFRVRAQNDAGLLSDWAMPTPVIVGDEPDEPEMPRNLVVQSKAAGIVELEWIGPEDDADNPQWRTPDDFGYAQDNDDMSEVLRYRIERQGQDGVWRDIPTPGATHPHLYGDRFDDIRTQSYHDTEAPAGAEFNYRVSALFHDCYVSAATQKDNIVVARGADPTNVRASSANGTVTVQWTHGSAWAMQVIVVVNVADDTDYCLQVDTSGTDQEFDCRGRTAGATYAVLVIGLDGQGGYKVANVATHTAR